VGAKKELKCYEILNTRKRERNKRGEKRDALTTAGKGERDGEQLKMAELSTSPLDTLKETAETRNGRPGLLAYERK